jgi:salicylate hydroxylase
MKDRMIYHRMDLHDVLKDFATSSNGLGPPATIKTSSNVVDCDPDEGAVTLKNGEVLRGDLIVGADGM